MMIAGRGIVSAWRCIALLLAFVCAVSAADRVRADEPIEIFDAHMHYNWEPKPFYSVDEVLALFKKHRVTGILATSRPPSSGRIACAPTSRPGSAIPSSSIS